MQTRKLKAGSHGTQTFILTSVFLASEYLPSSSD